MDEYSTLLQYKELLDEGIITQEEFDSKKRELLFAKEIQEEQERKAAEAAREEMNEKRYYEAVAKAGQRTSASYTEALHIFEELGDWKDAAERAAKCREELPGLKIQEKREKDAQIKYDRAMNNMKQNNIASYKSAIADLESLGDWKDAPKFLEEAQFNLTALEEKEAEEARKKEEKKQKRADIMGRKSTKAAIIGAVLLIIAVIVFFAYINPNVIKPMQAYNHAVDLLEQGEYVKAEREFEALGDYKDAKTQIENCKIAKADDFVSRKHELQIALSIYEKYQKNENVTKEKINKCKEAIYNSAKEYYGKGLYNKAKSIFSTIKDYSDSKAQIELCDKAIKEKEEADRKAKEEAEKKKAEEQAKAREESGLIGTWYAKDIINYRDEDMTDQMGDLRLYYITFNEDGTGVFSVGEDSDNSSFGGKHDFTWKIEDTGVGNGAVGTWTMAGDSDTIFYYGDHVLVYTDKMNSIFYDMRFFCYK